MSFRAFLMILYCVVTVLCFVTAGYINKYIPVEYKHVFLTVYGFVGGAIANSLLNERDNH